MEKNLPKDNKSSDKSNDSANEVNLQRVRTYEDDLKSATKGHSAEEVQPIVKQQSDKKLNEKKIEKIKEQTRRQEVRKLAREAREKKRQEKREAKETRRKAKETRKKEKRAQKEARKQAWIDAKLAKKKAKEDEEKAKKEKIIADKKAKEDAKQKAIEQEALAIKQKKEAEEAEILKKEQERLAIEEEKKRKLEQERLAAEEAKRLEEEKLKKEEAERLRKEQEKLIEEEKKRKLEQERLAAEEAIRLQEEQDRLKKEEAERLQKEQEKLMAEQAEKLQKEEENKRKLEEEKLAIEQENARKIEEAKRLEEEKLRAEEIVRLQKEQERIAIQQTAELEKQKEAQQIIVPTVEPAKVVTAPKIATTAELPKKKWFRLQEKTNVRAPKQLENRVKEDHKKEILIGAVTLVVIGLIIIIFISIFSKDKSPLPTIVVDPSNILDTLVVAKIDTTDKTNAELISLIREQMTQDVQENTLNEITLTERVNVAGKNTEKRINSAKLLSILETRLSGRLSRSLAEDAVIGYYEGTENSPFILIKIDDFQNAFAGMLEWENLIVDDVSKIFNKVAVYKENLKPESQSISFKDKVIKNTDARVIKDEFENIKFFYMFLDNGNYLLLADDEYATEVIINELRNRRLVK